MTTGSDSDGAYEYDLGAWAWIHWHYGRTKGGQVNRGFLFSDNGDGTSLVAYIVRCLTQKGLNCNFSFLRSTIRGWFPFGSWGGAV